jgi:RNA 3'-terminal phosphate cyclase
MDVRAAVHVVGDAGDVAGLLAAEEGDEVGNVVDVADAADRYLGDQLRLALALQGPCGDIGAYQ